MFLVDNSCLDSKHRYKLSKKSKSVKYFKKIALLFII